MVYKLEEAITPRSINQFLAYREGRVEGLITAEKALGVYHWGLRLHLSSVGEGWKTHG